MIATLLGFLAIFGVSSPALESTYNQPLTTTEVAAEAEATPTYEEVRCYLRCQSQCLFDPSWLGW